MSAQARHRATAQRHHHLAIALLRQARARLADVRANLSYDTVTLDDWAEVVSFCAIALDLRATARAHRSAEGRELFLARAAAECGA